METLRTFIAVAPDESVLAEVAAWQEELARVVRGFRWVPRRQWHVTLRFLGETPIERVGQLARELEEVARGVAPFRAVLRGAGVFPPRGQPRVLWVGVEAGEAIHRLQEMVEEAVLALGYEREERPFRPHLTLARAGRSGGDPGARTHLAAVRERVWGSWQVSCFALFKSELRQAGAVYTVLEEFSLGGRAGG